MNTTGSGLEGCVEKVMESSFTAHALNFQEYYGDQENRAVNASS